MSFIVSASTTARDVSYRRGSMLAALEQGLTLLSCGMTDVWITDLSGRRRTPAEFSRLVFTGERAPQAGTAPAARHA